MLYMSMYTCKDKREREREKESARKTKTKKYITNARV